MTDNPFDFSEFELSDTAEDMTAEAGQYWERAMFFSPDELAQMDDFSRAIAALIHPPHPTIQ